MKLLKWLNENFEKYILVASLVVMIVIIFVQVVLRYCFGTTISWGEELTRYIMLYQIWIGAAYAVKEDAHLRITTFRDKFSKKNSMRIENGVLVLWMAFAAFISVKGVELVNFLIDEFKGKGVNISLPSLRIDAFSLDVMSKVQDIKKSSLTFAPEAGSQRLRDVINKGLTEEVILNGSRLAFEGGWNKVKLYFMLGLPTETEEDMKAIPQLANEIAALYYDTVPKEKRNGKCQITISTSFFVPKPFTPFQWAGMYTPGDYLARARVVNEGVHAQLNHKSIKYNWHEADVTVLEGILARGDRKIGQALLKVYEKGGIFDAWSEYFDYQRWEDAFAECGIDTDFYTMRERDLDEIFPWDFIDTGVSKEFLKREWKNAHDEKVTPNCRMKCSGCGAMKFGGGVCFENKD